MPLNLQPRQIRRPPLRLILLGFSLCAGTLVGSAPAWAQSSANTAVTCQPNTPTVCNTTNSVQKSRSSARHPHRAHSRRHATPQEEDTLFIAKAPAGPATSKKKQ